MTVCVLQTPVSGGMGSGIVFRRRMLDFNTR